MSKQEDNFWMHFAIFTICWFGFFGLVLPIIDEVFLGNAYRHFICEYGFTLPLESSKEFCSK